MGRGGSAGSREEMVVTPAGHHVARESVDVLDSTATRIPERQVCSVGLSEVLCSIDDAKG
jgi:hypothetical protein